MTKEYVLKRKKRRKKHLLIAVSSLVFLTIFIFSLMYINNNYSRFQNQDKELMNYQEKGNIDYKVYLKPNNYFSESYLPSGSQYITSVIKNINSNFIFALSTSEFVNVTYTYKAIAYLDVAEKGGSNIWNKQYSLLDSVTITKENVKEIALDENIVIDYNQFNNYVTEFKKDYTIAINANLNVDFIIEINGIMKDYDEKFSDYVELKMNIPLSEQTIKITTENNLSDNNIVEASPITENDRNFFVLAVLGCIISALGFIWELLRVFFKDEASEYEKEIRKILKANDDIIVTSKKEIDLSDNKIIEVANFDELLDAQQELRIPINFFETKKEDRAIFVILNDNTAWRYTIKDKQKEHHEHKKQD